MDCTSQSETSAYVTVQHNCEDVPPAEPEEIEPAGDPVVQEEEESSPDEISQADDDTDTEYAEELGAGATAEDEETDEQFDISLPATHSYLSGGLVAVRGRSVLEAGWRGRVPCVAHHSVLYPGETVPMMMSHPRDSDTLQRAIQTDRLFGLLFAERSDGGDFVSGYGVLCEVFEATRPESDSPSEFFRHSLAFKARARQRFRLVHTPRRQPAHEFTRVKPVDVCILPEVEMSDPLYTSRLLSLDPLRSTTDKQKYARVRRMDAAVTNWPLFVYESCDFKKIAKAIDSYFWALNYKSLPTDMVSLSFWTASNLPLSYKDRLGLFKVDSALQRLRIMVNFVEEYYVLCCESCGDVATQIARREDIFAMSSEGMKSNYCNLGGYVHDIMTVSQVTNVQTNGRPSAEFSWFPGYLWSIVVCQHCHSHIGWKFTASKRSFKLQTFWAICRNYVFPLHSPGDKLFEKEL